MMRRGRFMRRMARRAFTPEIPPVLQRANQLLANREYAAAAEAFEQLARGAQARSGPRAPLFFLQASRARILNNQTAEGMTHLKQGLTLLAGMSQWQRFQQAGQRAISELNERGLTTEAGEIETFLKSRMPTGFSGPDSFKTEGKKPMLPTHCPSCGAAVRADEVEWLDEATAECAYCGSPVRGEE